MLRGRKPKQGKSHHGSSSSSGPFGVKSSLSAGEQHMAFGSPAMRMTAAATLVSRALYSLYLYTFMVQIMMIEFIEKLLRATNCARYQNYVISFNPYNNFMRKALLLLLLD